MKKIYLVPFLLAAATLFTGCKDDDDPGMTTDETLDLKVSSPLMRNDTIILSEEYAKEEVLTFNWSQASDRGEGYSLTYIFRMDKANSEFKTSTDPEIMEEGVFFKNVTAEDLNDYMTELWGVYPGDVSTLEARIVAKVTGPKFLYPAIGLTKFTVKSYTPKSRPLYILGTATEAGADPSKAIRMTEVSNGKLYTWQGNMTPGQFKFITSKESVLPSYNRGENDSTLVERTNAGEPDNWFELNAEQPSGYYAIALSLKKMSIVCRYIPYQHLYLVGNGCAAEWDTGKAIEFKTDQMNPGIFTCEADLIEGELKILTVRDFNGPTYRPLTANAPVSETRCQVYEGGDDLKWYVTANDEGTYLITVNVGNNTISFQKK